ncbi:MAG: hypothetical protein J7L89_07320 [Bacteroidales bacterium]|nr:hypothetical protein [Bacteroidales bacterium]
MSKFLTILGFVLVFIPNCIGQVDTKNSVQKKNVLLLRIVPYPSILGLSSYESNAAERDIILSKFRELVPPNLVMLSYDEKYNSEIVLGEIYFGYMMKTKELTEKGHWIVNGIPGPDTVRTFWNTKFKFCVNSSFPNGLSANWELLKIEFETEQPDYDPRLEPLESNRIWDSLPILTLTHVDKSSLYMSFSLGIVATNGMAGARWDFDFYQKKSPFGLKFGLRQLGTLSYETVNYYGYFYDVSGEVGIFGAIKNRTNRLELFTALDIGNSQIKNTLSEEKKYINDLWFAPVVGFQYYLTNIGHNGITFSARMVKPISNSFVVNPYVEVGVGISWGGILKSGCATKNRRIR